MEQRRQTRPIVERQLDLGRHQRRVEVRQVPRTDDRGVDPWMMECPCQRQCAQLDLPDSRLLGEASKASKDVIAYEMSVRFRPQRHPRAFGILSGPAVLASQPAASQRAEG